MTGLFCQGVISQVNVKWSLLDSFATMIILSFQGEMVNALLFCHSGKSSKS